MQERQVRRNAEGAVVILFPFKEVGVIEETGLDAARRDRFGCTSRVVEKSSNVEVS